MREFNIAAKRAAGEAKESIAIPFGERTLVASEPSPGQVALFYDRVRSDPSEEEPDSGPVGAVFGFLRGVLADGDLPYIKQLLQDDRIDFDLLIGGDDEGGGLVDTIMEEFSGRPTGPSTDSSAQRASSGRPSTGRTPGKGSTSSGTRSTGSSTSSTRTPSTTKTPRASKPGSRS